MKNDLIVWRTLSRDAVPDVLLGRLHLTSHAVSSISPYDFRGGDVAVGYLQSRENEEYNPPCLLMVGEEKSIETFSWLRVYAGETAPLSQYVRVISESDWQRFNTPAAYGQIMREDIWASVVLGEVIAQGDNELGVSALPLSRAGACFSMAVARAACTHRSDTATKTCLERLRFVENDRRFVRRPVTVNELLPIWSMASSGLRSAHAPSETAMLVVEEAQRFMPDAARSFFTVTPINLRDIPQLFSDSIEERVLAYQQITGHLLALDPKDPKNSFSSVILAGAAFLVGRGTAHEFLLRRVSKNYPSAAAWYGLIAALAGPESWDANWSRAAKGIERQIRSRFDWAEAVGFDLCWQEYSWISTVFENADVFSSLPKLMPKVLSVEVVPGSSCQFRLAGPGSADVEIKQPRDNSRERDLQAALSQFVSLANRARSLLDDSLVSPQQTLDLESSNETVRPTKRRPRRL